MIREKIRLLLRHHRKATIGVLVAFVGVVGIGVYVFSSVNFWNGYKASYSQWQQTIQKDTATALKMSASNTTERTAKIAALENVSKDIGAAEKTLCRGYTLIQWQQQFIAAVKSQIEACSKLVDAARKFGTRLADTVHYLKNEQALVDIFAKSTSQGKKITEKSFESQIGLWQVAIKDVKEMSVGQGFTPVKNNAEKTAQAMKAAWQAIYDAHKAKNKAKYIEAQGKLAAAYDTMPAIAAENSRHFAKLAGSMQSAYDDMVD